MLDQSAITMATRHRTFFLTMAAYWLAFGLGTTLYPRMMQLFMTPDGVAATTSFSNQVWLHGGMDILSVCVLLYALSAVPATKRTLRLAAFVGALPAAAIVYTLIATPFWTPLFLVPAVGCLAFTAYGLLLASRLPEAGT